MIALFDVIMPGLDGPSVVAQIKLFCPALRYALVSGSLGNYTTDELLADGALAALPKPITPAELLERDDEFLNFPIC